MTDFPPNPEDGELWLPSDVFHEIASSNITLTASAIPTPTPNNNNGGAGNTTQAPHFLLHDQPSISSPTSLPYPPPYFHQVVFPSGDPNGIGSIGNGVPIVNNHYYSYASWNGVFQLFPGSIHFFHPFAPTQIQGFVECPNWALLQGTSHAKCGGTGVFLPRSADHHHDQPQQQVVVQKFENQIVVNHQELEESSRGSGTGVFLNQQVVITARKKTKSN